MTAPIEIRSFERWRGTIGLIAGPLLALGALLLPFPGLSPEAHRLAAVVTLVIIFWLTEAIPIPVTALLANSGDTNLFPRMSAGRAPWFPAGAKALGDDLTGSSHSAAFLCCAWLNRIGYQQASQTCHSNPAPFRSCSCVSEGSYCTLSDGTVCRKQSTE